MPSMDFTSPRKYRFRAGRLYLGTSTILGRPLGIQTERHAIAFAGARTGKGACIIMPNLKRWIHNALVIDPKGEAAEAAAKWREDLGQKVYVVDPFLSARLPDHQRAHYNPLDDLDPDGLTIKEDIQAIADGIVMRPDPNASHWDDGAMAIISGLIGYVKTCAPDGKKNLLEVRRILADEDALADAMNEMKNIRDCAGVCLDAYAAIKAQEGGYFVSNAKKNTLWIDSKGMANALSKSTFSLSELKSGRASVFLVLPANYLGQHGRFLRLFVRSAIEAMSRKTARGELKDQECLFLLDEFYSLGYIDEIAKAAGLMPGYGLHLFPILQDLGQLVALYGQDGVGTFFGNADAHIFFGNSDPQTVDHVSATIGQRHESGALGGDKEMIGRPLMSPREVKAHVAKKDKAIVARRMIVFAQGDDILSVKPRPYFKDKSA